MPVSPFTRTDEELQAIMLQANPAANVYKECFDVLLLRSHERLIEKTENLIKETNGLVGKTWWVAFGTWVMALGTLLIAGATIITILWRC